MALILEDLKNTRSMLKHTKFPYKKAIFFSAGTRHRTVGTVLMDSGLTNYLQYCFQCSGFQEASNRVLWPVWNSTAWVRTDISSVLYFPLKESALGELHEQLESQGNCRSAVCTDGAENTHYHLRNTFSTDNECLLQQDIKSSPGKAWECEEPRAAGSWQSANSNYCVLML